MEHRFTIAEILDRIKLPKKSKERMKVYQKIRSKRIRREAWRMRRDAGVPEREMPRPETLYFRGSITLRDYYEKKHGREIKTMRELQAKYCQKILEITNHNMTHAALLMGMNVRTLRNWKLVIQHEMCPDCWHYTEWCRCK